MASSSVQDGPGPTAGSDAVTLSHDDMREKLQQQTDTLPSSTPVEMSEMSQRQPLPASTGPAPSPTVAGVTEAQAIPAATSSAEKAAVPISTPHQTLNTSDNVSSSPPAIGPGMDHNPSAGTILANFNITSPPNPTTSPPTPGPTILITLMLQNGQRHPYKIDTAYLRKRNVFKPETEADGKDPNPFDISVYTLKELIWRDWREEWEPRPTIPGSIRLIFFGRLLDDKVVLRDAKLNPNQPNIIHISVKPQDLIDEEENSKLKGLKSKSGSTRSRSRRGGADGSDDGQTSAGCCSRCCVM